MNAIDPQLNILTNRCTDLYTLPPTTITTTTSSSSSSSSPPSITYADMASWIRPVEEILDHSFKDKTLLEEALTHSSFISESRKSYQRLEFIGDAALGLALSNHVYLIYPDLDHGLYRFLRHNAASLRNKIKDFVDAVGMEDDMVVYGGSIKAPKILADIVESVAAAIYVDVNYDLQKFWVTFRGLLEPIITLEDLQQQPQPVTMLFELCQKQGKQVDIKHWRNGAKNIASVYVDGAFVASGSSEQKEIAKLNAAKQALLKLSKSIPTNIGMLGYSLGLNGSFEIEGAKQKLHELCCKKKWPKATYSTEKDEGPAHDKKYVSSVQIATVDGVFYMEGDEKSRVKDAENSAASFLIRALQESNYL